VMSKYGVHKVLITHHSLFIFFTNLSILVKNKIMNMKKPILVLLFLGFCLVGKTQDTLVADTARVDEVIQQSKAFYTTDFGKAVDLSNQALKMAERINYHRGRGYSIKSIGMANYFSGKYFEALEYFQKSLSVFDSIQDYVGIGNLYNNIGVVYYDQGDDGKALENYLQSLRYAGMTKDKLRILTALNNVGGVYSEKENTWDKALNYYLQALPIAEELKDQKSVGDISVNIGTIYFRQKDDEKALSYFNKSLKAYGSMEGSMNAHNAIGQLYLREDKYDEAIKSHNQALAISRKVGSKMSIIQSLTGLGDVYKKMEKHSQAINYYKQAEVIGVEIQANHELSPIYKNLAVAFAKTKNYGQAFHYQALYADLKDTLYNQTTYKKLSEMQFEFDIQQKEGEINLLTKDKQLQEIQLQRSRFTRNALTGGLVLILIIAFIIFRNYRAKVKINKILDRQKEQIEHLLLNILPSEVARELQESGHATPRNYESVSVLFTDFKGFTSIAEKLSPSELVDELNACFMSFDDIIERNGLEKIKTIGDSYMCAGGIPTPDEQHVFKIVRASLEIQEYIALHNENRRQKGLVPWDVRVGIHVGPVVAGVVGKKKYAYDIWGSTVNIASRMESNGEPGQVNISSATYELIKNKYACKYRGKIHAKNVGEIDMYFIDHELGMDVRSRLGEMDERDLSRQLHLPARQEEDNNSSVAV
jgi:adenylate cyclase